MSDLISRSALIKYLTIDGYIPKTIKEAIELQPTAYNVDEVVKEVKEISMKWLGEVRTCNVIKVIRKGGVE